MDAPVGSAPGEVPGSRAAARRSQKSAAARSRRRRIAWVLVGGGLLIFIALGWVAVTALLARRDLERVRTDVAMLQTALADGNSGTARSVLSDLGSHARSAHELTSGPAWAVLAHLPAGGEPLRSARGIAEAADELAHGPLAALVTSVQTLDPAGLRSADGGFDLARLTSAAAPLGGADASLHDVMTHLEALPSHTWLSSVDSARAELLERLRGIAGSTRTADLATHIAPTMLGQHGTQRYFVAFQNPAEARGTGGVPGAFAILAVRHGQFHFERFESDNALDHVASGLHLGADFDNLYDSGHSTDLYVNSNLSPNFPYAAQIWVAMWEHKTGQHLNGALSLDPTALSYLLQVTGPAQLGSATTITSDNVVALTEQQAYAKYAGDVAARRAYLRAIATAVSEHLVTAHGSTRSLLTAAGRSAGEGRLLLWSADPHTEQLLEHTPLAGAVPRTTRPYGHLSIVNDGGNKLDYYLDRTLDYQREGCGSTRAVTVSIGLHNAAPAGLPTDVTARTDVHSYPVRAGDNRLEVSWLATQGAQLRSVTVDGRAATVTAGFEKGHPVFVVDLELPRGATRSVVLHLVEPAGTGSPLLAQQPLARPMVMHVHDTQCS